MWIQCGEDTDLCVCLCIYIFGGGCWLFFLVFCFCFFHKGIFYLNVHFLCRSSKCQSCIWSISLNMVVPCRQTLKFFIFEGNNLMTQDSLIFLSTIFKLKKKVFLFVQLHVSSSLPVAYGLTWHCSLPVLAVGGDQKVHLWVVESTWITPTTSSHQHETRRKQMGNVYIAVTCPPVPQEVPSPLE